MSDSTRTTWRRRAAALIAGTAATALALAGCTGSGDSPSAEGNARRGLPAASAESMLLPESFFPSLPNAVFETGTSADAAEMRTDSPSCDAALGLGEQPDRDNARRGVSSAHNSSRFSESTVTAYEVGVHKEAGPATLAALDEAMAHCDTFVLDLGDQLTGRFELKAADLAVEGNARTVVMSGVVSVGDYPFRMTLYSIVGTERDVGMVVTGAHTARATGDTNDTAATGDTDTSEIAGTAAKLYHEQRLRVLDAD